MTQNTRSRISNPDLSQLLLGWVVDSVDSVEPRDEGVRFLFRRNNRRREAVLRNGVLHISDLYLSQGSDLRVYRTWHTFAEAVAKHPHPFVVCTPLAEQHQALGVTCTVTGDTLWVSLPTLRKHMVETVPKLPLSSENYRDVLTRLCEKHGQQTVPLAACHGDEPRRS